MNYYLEKHDIDLILDALESYREDIEHGNNTGHKYIWTVEEVDNLMDSLSEYDD